MGGTACAGQFSNASRVPSASQSARRSRRRSTRSTGPMQAGPARLEGISKYLQDRLEGVGADSRRLRSIRRALIRATCHRLTLIAPRPSASIKSQAQLGSARARGGCGRRRSSLLRANSGQLYLRYRTLSFDDGCRIPQPRLVGNGDHRRLIDDADRVPRKHRITRLRAIDARRHLHLERLG
jgi:hypothetical protein